jgi:hypothetical protein
MGIQEVTLFRDFEFAPQGFTDSFDKIGRPIPFEEHRYQLLLVIHANVPVLSLQSTYCIIK